MVESDRQLDLETGWSEKQSNEHKFYNTSVILASKYMNCNVVTTERKEELRIKAGMNKKVGQSST